MHLYALTIHELHDLLARKEVSATDVVSAFLARIEQFDRKLNCFLTPLAEAALDQARQFDQGTTGEELSPLAAIPLAIKDVICMQGVRTTCGSRTLDRFVPPYDATVTEHLKQAGAIFLNSPWGPLPRTRPINLPAILGT
jgi:aspartyl-tRNA(Asn)/glutamyl-tRNA(Gln) amidotransferase subunit A